MAEYKGDFQQADNLYSVEEIKSKTGATDKQIMQAVQDNLDNPFGVRVGSVSGVHYSQDVLETIQKNLAEGKKMNVEKTMTTKELADVLGVDVKTIQRASTDLFDSTVVKSISTGGRPSQVFTEEQATQIKQEIQKHHNLSSRQIDSVSTKIEIIANYKNATEQMIAMLDNENAELKSEVATLKPKADIAIDFIDRNHLTNFRDTSNILGITQKDLMQILFPKYIYKNSVGEYRCYAEYSKYFALRPFQKGIEKTGQQLMLTLEGLEFFKSKCEVKNEITL